MGLKKEIIGAEESNDSVVNYEPKQFPLRVPESASNFVSSQEFRASEFKISELVAQQAGVAELNRQKIEEQVEAEALEKLKEIEEKAYSEAYELGLIEGTDKAFNDHRDELKERLDNLDQLLVTLDNIKKELISKNEVQILKLLNIMAGKIAMDHVETNKEALLSVIKQVIEVAQTEEDVLLHVSFNDHMFLESLREKMDKKLDFLKRVKVEPNDDVQTGGCILETKYGAIDARLEERVNKVWQALKGKLPRLNPDYYTDSPTEDDVDENKDKKDPRDQGGEGDGSVS